MAKRYNTVVAMVNDLSGSRSEFARSFRALIKRKRRLLSPNRNRPIYSEDKNPRAAVRAK